MNSDGRKTPRLVSAETPTFHLMRRHIELIRKMNSMGAIIGSPGTGKSHLVDACVDSDYGCICITPTRRTRNYKDALRMIDAAMNGGNSYLNSRNAHSLERDLYDRLDNKHHWLLVDEVQNFSNEIVRMLLAFNDHPHGPNIPVVLVGNPDRLQSNSSERFALEQITSRIEDLTLFLDTVPWRDVEAIAMSNGLTGADAFAHLRSRWENGLNLRKLTNFLSSARLLVPEGPITLKALQAGMGLSPMESQNKTFNFKSVQQRKAVRA